MTSQAEKVETPEQKSSRLKLETHNTVDRLWSWAENNKVFGNVELRIPFENGVPQRIYVSPTEVLT